MKRSGQKICGACGRPAKHHARLKKAGNTEAVINRRNKIRKGH